MAFQNVTKGGAFKAPSTTQSFTHNHASQMAHAAQRRLAVAKALSAAPKPPGMAGAPVGGPATSVMPPPPAGGNFKAHIAHGLAQRGVNVSMNHIHGAIDSLTQKGALTPYQGSALKQHNGPLQGPAGQRTMGMIANEIATGPKPGMGV